MPRSRIKYLLVIDFEANTGKIREIIEFPVILVELNTGDILAEFHQYVRPEENPILTYRCKNITGIQQRVVNQANSLDEVLYDLKCWLKGLKKHFRLVLRGEAYGRIVNCAFASWGNYELERFLIPETSRKGIYMQNCLFHFIDIRKVLKSIYQDLGTSSLQNALGAIGMEFIGRPHSGIDDARNVAFLAAELYMAYGIKYKM